MRARSLVLVVAVLAIANAWPLLGRTTLPLVDVYQHEAQVAIWAKPRAGYEVALVRPYLVTYALWRAVAALAGGVDRATGPMVLLLAWLQPIAFAVLVAARQRSPVVGWAGLVPALGYSLAFGFLPYHLGTTFALLSLAATTVWLRTGARRAGIGAALALLVATGTHALSGLVAVVGSLVLCLAQVRARARWTALAPIVPAGALIALWQATYVREPGADVGFLWISSVFTRLERYPIYVGGGFTVAADRWVLAALAIGAAIAAVAIVRRTDRGDAGLALVGAGLFACYLGAPDAWGHVHAFYGRFAPLSFLCLLAALPSPSVPRWVAIAPVAVLAISRARLATDLRAVDAQLGDVPALLDAIPAGATLVWPAKAPMTLPPFELPFLANLPARAVARTGSRAPLFYGAQMIVNETGTRADATWTDGTIVSPAPPDFVLMALPDPPRELGAYQRVATTPALVLYARR